MRCETAKLEEGLNQDAYQSAPGAKIERLISHCLDPTSCGHPTCYKCSIVRRAHSFQSFSSKFNVSCPERLSGVTVFFKLSKRSNLLQGSNLEADA